MRKTIYWSLVYGCALLIFAIVLANSTTVMNTIHHLGVMGSHDVLRYAVISMTILLVIGFYHKITYQAGFRNGQKASQQTQSSDNAL